MGYVAPSYEVFCDAERLKAWCLRNQRRRELQLKVVIATILLGILAIAGRAWAQEPPAPAPDGPTVSVHTGAMTLITRGEKREYAAARVTLNVPFASSWATFLRADLGGAQDGASLDFADPSSFRTLEGALGLRRRLGHLDVGALGGVTWSLEGAEGAPLDPRLWTAIGFVRFPIRTEGYVYIGSGLHQPVDGAALLVSVAVPTDDEGRGSFFADFALPFRETAFAEKAWTLKLGAAVRVWRRGL